MMIQDCPRTTLVEALRDGRLGPQESASMERHLEGCAACAELARDLAKIGDVLRAPQERLTPLEHQRARVALLQRAATQSPARAAPENRRYVFGAVLMAAAAVLGFLGGRWEKPSNQVAFALHIGVLPTIVNGSKIGFHPSDNARFSRNRTANRDELTLEHGILDIRLPKIEARKQFVVRTKDAQINVQSTAFRVEADEGRIRSVAVEQGSVEVQYAGFTAIIPAGGSWRATPESSDTVKPAAKTEADTASPVDTTNAPEHSAALSVTNRNTAQPATHQDRPRHEMYAPDKLDTVPTPETHDTPDTIEPSPTTIQPQPSAPQTATPPPPSEASRTFAEAMAAMRRGDYAGGAEKLEHFSQTHANDARADEADYLRAIALQRAGHRKEAIAAAKQYLATRPKGAHRADALRIAGQ